VTLGGWIGQLESDAGAAIDALGDVALYARVACMAKRHDETFGEYARNASRRFAAMATDEEWLALRNAAERAANPANAALGRILDWSLARDEAETADGDKSPPCACGNRRDEPS
jgi:hypothetical protein